MQINEATKAGCGMDATVSCDQRDLVCERIRDWSRPRGFPDHERAGDGDRVL